MTGVLEKSLSCPYCGEAISILVDDSDVDQSYIEDCQVCCRPISLSVIEVADGGVSVIARAENE